MNNNKKLPFSKKVVTSAKFEAYAVTFLLFFFVWFDKDVSSIAILASLSWAGLSVCRNFYIWMAKHEHIMDKKIEYKKASLDTTNLDYEIDTLENENFDIDTF